ncbi:hypothetical protein EsVE80_05770 [Enterococcus saigonensis]|uniref:Uncharacterized protein n=1 Tax=Enterococcus saigonensis TaxID=1805431 RepID=A0A679IMP9_9ENTE|nr:hypothetical protein [Enterococcus saigonensis]BCA85054.1 hypothetical protein EsVE80_05770 [Enterococcus saigonensis]
MKDTLKKEWEKLFNKTHDLAQLKNLHKNEKGHFITPDGVKTEVWEKHDETGLNALMASDWESFLDGNDVFSQLSLAEQNELKANAPRYEDYQE